MPGKPDLTARYAIIGPQKRFHSVFPAGDNVISPSFLRCILTVMANAPDAFIGQHEHSLWHNRNYVLLWSGQAISRVGSRASALAFPLLVLALTQSPAQAGLIGAIGSVPSLILSLPAGAFLDRWDRKQVMIVCEIGRALLLASIPLTLWLKHLTMAQLYLVALCEGALAVFFGIAQTACLPQVVTNQQLPAAAAQNEALFPVGDLLGSPLGGTLFGLVGRAAPFLADACSYLFSIGALWAVKISFQQERRVEAPHLRREIRTGLMWLWHHPLIRFLALLSAGCFVIDAGAPLMVIVLAKQQGASARLIGIVFAIAAVGGLAAFFVVAPLQRRWRFGQIVCSTVMLQACVWPLLVFPPLVLAIGLLAAGNYLFFALYNSVEAGYRLALVPDALQGRVNSVFHLIALSCYPLGAAVTGLLIQWIGVKPTLLLFFAWMLMLSVAAISNRAVRWAQPLQPEIMQQEHAP